MTAKGEIAVILTQIALRSCRLQSFLREELSLSSTLVKRLKWKNALFVNGERSHTDRVLSPGDTVSVLIEEAADGFPAEPMELHILYEDEYLIALDKPAGMAVHPSPSRNEGTLANGLLHYYRQSGQPCGIHPVCRLDRDTVGVVLLAKSSHIHAKFHKMHMEKSIGKTYHAVTFGCPEKESGVIDLPIKKVGGGSLLRVIDGSGQRAVSEYRILAQRNEFSKLELHPITGRTHQLRLHCLASGFPILGDPQYNTQESLLCSQKLGLQTQLLCAFELSFVHPISEDRIVIRSAQDFCIPDKDGCTVPYA